MKHQYLLTAKITTDVDILKTVQELGNTLHFRRNFWYLIMASTKLI